MTDETLIQALLLKGESRRRFTALVGQLNEDLKPETHIDRLLIGRMAAAHWRQMRLWDLEKQGVTGLSEMEMRLDRQFHRTLERYQRIKKNSGQTNPTTP